MSFTPTEIAAEIKNTFLNLPSLMSLTVKKIADSQQVLMMLKPEKTGMET
jgi:hypothetical protein